RAVQRKARQRALQAQDDAIEMVERLASRGPGVERAPQARGHSMPRRVGRHECESYARVRLARLSARPVMLNDYRLRRDRGADALARGGQARALLQRWTPASRLILIAAGRARALIAA